MPFINGGCDKDNIASYKVMEKIGMKQNGFEENGDPLFYIDAELYRNRQKRDIFGKEVTHEIHQGGSDSRNTCRE